MKIWVLAARTFLGDLTGPILQRVSILLTAVAVVVGAACGWLLSSRRGRTVGPRRVEAEVEADSGDAEWAVDLRSSLAAAPIATIVVDREGVVTFANDAAQADYPTLATGLRPSAWSESLGELIERANIVGGEDTRAVVNLGDPPRSLRAVVAPIALGALVMLVDVTEEVDFDEARRTFSAAVSHELRTPLARILGLAETLALPELEHEREQLVQQIENEVDGMRRLIDEMLLLAALDRGRLAVADGVVDVVDVAYRVVDDARQRRLGRGRMIELETTIEVDVPIAARLCEVVVTNLVDNALIHGGPEAEVTVAVAEVGGMAQIIVRDTGFGIGPQHLPFVFQRFYRGDPSRSGPGSGLGLALVKHIVEAHGGSVSAESDGLTGTTLRVVLPLA